MLAALPAATDAAGKRKPKLKVVYVEDKGVVQPNATDGYGETCPKAAPHAIGGYFGTDTQGDTPMVAITQSAPYGKRGKNWSIGVKDLSDEPQSFFVGVVCANGGPYKLVSRTGAADGGQTDGFDVSCPRTFPKPISSFFYATTEDTGQLVLVSSSPTGGRDWTTVVKNVTDQPQAWVAGTVCAAKTQKVGYLGGDRSTVQSGKTDGATGTCSGKTPHAVSGSLGIPQGVDFGNVTLAGSYPSGSKGRAWSALVANQSPDPQDYLVGAVCIG